MSSTPLARVALIGLGASGRAAGRALLRRRDCRVVAAADIDPELVGVDLGRLLDVGPLGVTVAGPGAPVGADVDVAIVATTAVLSELEPTVGPLLDAGVDVLSLCEELAYPWHSHPDVARRLDARARARGTSLLGTGCNPGFIMDTLPLVLSGLCDAVDRVEIERAAELSPYGAVVREFGVGLRPDEFERAAGAGRLAGHVGFEQSVAMVAAGLGWPLDGIDVDPVRAAIVAREDRVGLHVTVPAGCIAAVTQSARGRSSRRTVIDINMSFGFFAPGDDLQAGDACRLHTGGRVLEVRAPGGYDSVASSAALVANLAATMRDLEPGLRSMADLRVTQLAGAAA